jgi:hypothetical protein
MQSQRWPSNTQKFNTERNLLSSTKFIYAFRTVFRDNSNSVQQNINIFVFILATQFYLYEEEIEVHINVILFLTSNI